MAKARYHGFTLIELLVVVSIIALMASFVLAALAHARNAANDAAVRQELGQLRNLYLSASTPSGNYSALQPAVATQPWQKCQSYTSGNIGYVCQMTTAAQCTQVFAHDTLTPSTDAQTVCVSIIKDSSFVEIGLYSNSTQHFSFIGFLPSAQQYFCYGDSGNNSTFTLPVGTFPSTITGETYAGCPGNP